jgi:hypothetical protein
MKKTFLVIATLFLFVKSYSQNKDSTLPKLVGDTLFTTSGYKIVEKQDIKIGTGSMPDGDFKFIRTNSASLFAYHSNTGYNGLANQANSFPRSQSGLTYKIKRLEKRGNKKHGYVYYAVIGSGLVNYEMDVENAIASGELSVPDEFKPKPKTATTIVEVKQQISVADELAKLKKLYDDGVLTKEEYEAQKKKLLEKN